MTGTGNAGCISEFWVAGLSYRTVSTATRGLFSINNEQYEHVLQLAASRGIREVFVLSTCNRTEIYGFAPSFHDLLSLICPHDMPDARTMHSAGYVKNGWEAAAHLFSVCSGLDSQILGDYEIVGQVKSAVEFANKRGFIGTHIGRLVNKALRASKAIRTNTRLSTGTASVAFAAVQYINTNSTELRKKKILLVGTGKFGRTVCKSLVSYARPENITVVNRTDEKAVALAAEFGLRQVPGTELGAEIPKADIIIVATNAPTPLITVADLEGASPKLLIDLSIPCNIAPEAASLAGMQLINVDALSRIKDESLRQREAEIPQANAIIAEELKELESWFTTRTLLSTVKKKLQTLNTVHYENGERKGSDPKQLDSIIAGLAVKVKQDDAIGCHCIHAFNQLIGGNES
jgi:glutamyl-tRNA reductase